METAFSRFESTRLLSLVYLARTCLWRKAWTVCEPQRSWECYQRQMAWCCWSHDQESYTAVEKAFRSSGKAEWRTYSAHFLLISWLMITVTFWCSLRTSDNINDEPLDDIVWRCLLTAYVLFSLLILITMLLNAVRMFGTFSCATRGIVSSLSQQYIGRQTGCISQSVFCL